MKRPGQSSRIARNTALGNGYSMWVSLIAYGYRTLEEVEQGRQGCRLKLHIITEREFGVPAPWWQPRSWHWMELEKETIREHVTFRYGYDLSVGPEEVRVKDGSFSATCPVTVPQAFAALFAGRDYESTIFSGDSATPAGRLDFSGVLEIPGNRNTVR